MDDNIYQSIGRTQVIIEIMLWAYAIYVSDIVLIPSIFAFYTKTQFCITFAFVFHQLCVIRNMFKAMYIIPCVNIINTSSSSTSVYSSEETETVNKENDNSNSNKYTKCKKCSKDRPIRSHHCSICQKCIDKMDHHCYILNNCVGRQNYRFFFSYMVLTCINALMMSCLSFYSLYEYWIEVTTLELKSKPKGKAIGIFFQYLLKLPVRALILFIIAIIALIPLSYLILYHLWILSKGHTTIERKYPSLQISDRHLNKKHRPMREKISRMLHSTNWFSVYWPE